MSDFFTTRRDPIGLPRCNMLSRWDFFPLACVLLGVGWGQTLASSDQGKAASPQVDEKDEQMKFARVFKGMAASAVVALGVGMAPANAELIIDPADALGTINQTSNCNAACLSAILGVTVTEYYKANAGGPEAGLLAGSYSTVFGAGNETATISWDGPGLFDCGICILLVKDGNNTPNQIYFNLGPTGYGWDGMESIFVSDPLIWPRQGSISHVSLFSASVPTQQVPEPGSLTLLGIGLLGLAGLTRRRLAR